MVALLDNLLDALLDAWLALEMREHSIEAFDDAFEEASDMVRRMLSVPTTKLPLVSVSSSRLSPYSFLTTHM